MKHIHEMRIDPMLPITFVVATRDKRSGRYWWTEYKTGGKKVKVFGQLFDCPYRYLDREVAEDVARRVFG